MKILPPSDMEHNILENVLNTFLSIDKKIIALHNCSSDDFLSLNKTLKQNHEKATCITDHIHHAFDKMGTDGNLKHLQLIKISFGELRNDVVTFEQEITDSLEMLDKMQANFSLMFVPINNFKQNLTSLKLLLANIKLTNNLYDRSLKSFSETESVRIEGVLYKVKESCPVFEENIYVIQKHIKSLCQELTQLKDLISNDLLNQLESLQNDFDNLEKHTQETLSRKSTVEKISLNCRSSVGSIITNLQYHDIIRQKMEHIQQTHKLIINEIQPEGEAKSDAVSHAANPFLLQIPQIIEIQTAQLLHTNKEYQNAIEQISNKMVEIGQDMSSIARIFKSLCMFEFNGFAFSREKTHTAFELLVEKEKESAVKFTLLSEDINLVKRIVINLFDKFQDMDLIENAVEQSIIEKISFTNLLVSQEKETASQAQQILKLYADNHFEKKKIKTLFTETLGQLEEHTCRNTRFVFQNKGMSKINHNLSQAASSFRELIVSFECLENIQDEVMEKSMVVNANTKEVISNVKYYSFFEKTVDQLIKHFEYINSLITIQSTGYSNLNEREKGLEQIEKYYTMKSERIIHNKSLLNHHQEENLQELPEKDGSKGNDVEFF
jgi:hypothetical protein